MAARRPLILLAVLLAVAVAADGADRTSFRKYESRHFTMRFEGREDPALVWSLLERLESAYRDVGRRLGAFPGRRVPVVLYTDGEFPAQASVPHWAQGLFDGQIRLAVSWAALRDERLDQTLRHEYTHALVHARTRGNVPTWLSEGLAVANEGRGTERARHLARTADRLIPLNELHGSFMKLPPAQLQLAYAESEAAARYLLARHGEAAVRALLARLGKAQDFATAIQDVTGGTYAEFQSAWRRSLVGTGGESSGPPPAGIDSHRTDG